MKLIKRDDLDALIEASKKALAAMTPEQRAELHKAQQESWVRGEMGLKDMPGW